MPDQNHIRAALVIDAEYADAVAFNFIVNFERMLGRRVPPADLCQWLTCLVLDAGVRPGAHHFSVSWLHEARTPRLENMALQGAAYAFQQVTFHNALGTFELSAYPVEAELAGKPEFFSEAARTLSAMPHVEQVLLVPDVDRYAATLLPALPARPGGDTTLFALAPLAGAPCRVENLGYSVFHALGIRAEELEQGSAGQQE